MPFKEELITGQVSGIKTHGQHYPQESFKCYRINLSITKMK